MDHIPKFLVSLVLIMITVIVGVALVTTNFFIGSVRSYQDQVAKAISSADFADSQIEMIKADAASKGYELQIEKTDNEHIYKVDLKYQIKVPIFGALNKTKLTSYVVDYAALAGTSINAELEAPHIELLDKGLKADEGMSLLKIEKVDKAETYIVFIEGHEKTLRVDETELAASPNRTVDLTEKLAQIISDGEPVKYVLTAKAVATRYNDSLLSNSVVFVANCQHDYNDGIETPPTCTEDGYWTKTCWICGDVYDDIVEGSALGHDFGAWTAVDDTQHKRTCTRVGCDETETAGHNFDTVEPNCTTPGSKTCLDCGHVIVIDKLGHKFTNYVSDGNATCTEDGTKTAKCDRCDATDTVADVGSALGHDMTGDWVKYGNKDNHKKTCTRCSYFETQAHTWVAGEIEKNPTCLGTGIQNYSCSVCSETKTETLNATGHTTVQHAAKAPTCTEIGWEAYETCEKCDYTTYVELAAFGHEFSNEDATSEYLRSVANCTEAATYYKNCVRCGESSGEIYFTSGNALGHSYDGAVWESISNTQHQRFCIRGCGTDEIADHSFQITRQPTCTATGVKRCDDCSKELSIDKIAHTYRKTTVAPTCTERGYDYYKCACGTSEYKNNYKDSLGHDWSGWASVSDSQHKRTCQRSGCGMTETADHTWGAWSKKDGTYHKRNCTVCGVENTAKHTYGAYADLNATNHRRTCTVDGCTAYEDQGHNWGNWTPKSGGTQHTRTCTTCSRVENANHTWSTTWSDNGDGRHKAKCTTCDAYTYANHSYGNYVSYGNSTYHKRTCTASGCGASETQQHTWGDWSRKDDSYHTRNCTVSTCNQENKEAHTYGNWSVSRSPTTSATGTLSRTCSVGKCADGDTFTLPKLSTSNGYTYSQTKAPNCTETGNDRYKYTKDGQTFEFNVTLPALGHTYSISTIAPTCTAQGYTTHTCTRCEYNYKDTYKDALGHNQDNSKVADKYLKSGATCTAKAVYYKSCSRCGYHNTSNGTFENGNALGHNYTGNYSNYSSSQHRRKCSRCTTYEYVGHSMGNTATATVHQTCTASGCGYYTTTHTYDQETVNSKYLASAATCHADAMYYKHCSCGYNPKSLSTGLTFYNTGTKTSAHTKSGWITERTASAEYCGIQVKRCTVCGILMEKQLLNATNNKSSTTSGGLTATHTTSDITRDQLKNGITIDFKNYTLDGGYHDWVTKRSNIKTDDLNKLGAYRELDGYDRFLVVNPGDGFVIINQGTDANGQKRFQAGDTVYVTFTFYTTGGAQNAYLYAGNVGVDGNPFRYYAASDGTSRHIFGSGAYSTTSVYTVSADNVDFSNFWIYGAITDTQYVASITIDLVPKQVQTMGYDWINLSPTIPNLEQLKVGYDWNNLADLTFGSSGHYTVGTVGGTSGPALREAGYSNSDPVVVVPAGTHVLNGFNRGSFFTPGYRYTIELDYYAYADSKGEVTGALVEYDEITHDEITNEVEHSGNHNISNYNIAKGFHSLKFSFTTHGSGAYSNLTQPGIALYNLANELHIVKFKITLEVPDPMIHATPTESKGIGTYSFAAGSVPALSSPVVGGCGNGCCNIESANFVDLAAIDAFYKNYKAQDYVSDSYHIKNPYIDDYLAARLLNAKNGFSRYAYHVTRSNLQLDFTEGKLTAGKTYTVKMRVYMVDNGGDGSIALIPYDTAGRHLAGVTQYFQYQRVPGASDKVYDLVTTITIPANTHKLAFYYVDQEEFYIGNISVTQN